MRAKMNEEQRETGCWPGWYFTRFFCFWTTFYTLTRFRTTQPFTHSFLAMHSFPSTLPSPVNIFRQAVVFGVMAPLLVIVGLSELSTAVGQHASPVLTSLTGLANIFHLTEDQAEWRTAAPAGRPGTAFGTTETTAEWASVVPKHFRQ